MDDFSIYGNSFDHYLANLELVLKGYVDTSFFSGYYGSSLPKKKIYHRKKKNGSR